MAQEDPLCGPQLHGGEAAAACLQDGDAAAAAGEQEQDLVHDSQPRAVLTQWEHPVVCARVHCSGHAAAAAGDRSQVQGPCWACLGWNDQRPQRGLQPGAAGLGGDRPGGGGQEPHGVGDHAAGGEGGTSLGRQLDVRSR